MAHTTFGGVPLQPRITEDLGTITENLTSVIQKCLSSGIKEVYKLFLFVEPNRRRDLAKT